MPSKAEIARLAAAKKRDEQIRALAARMRDAAQATYDAAVASHQVEMNDNLAASTELDGYIATASDRARAVLVASKDAEMARHVDRVRALTGAVTAAAPGLALEAWLAEAEAQLAESLAKGA